jgi:hypothetical protein
MPEVNPNQLNWSFQNAERNGNVIVSVRTEWCKGERLFAFTAGQYAWTASTDDFSKLVDALARFRADHP